MKAPFFPFTKIIHVGVILGHFILVMVLGVSFWGLHQTVKSFESVAHSGEITTGLIRLFVDLNEAEDHQRGYLLSGKPEFLISYREAVKQIQNGMVQLQAVTTSKEPHDTKFQELYTMIQEHLNLLQNVLDQFIAQGPQSVRDAIIKGIGIEVMNEIRNFILEMSKSNSASLKKLDAAAHEMEFFTIKTMIVGIVLTPDDRINYALETSAGFYWTASSFNDV